MNKATNNNNNDGNNGNGNNIGSNNNIKKKYKIILDHLFIKISETSEVLLNNFNNFNMMKNYNNKNYNNMNNKKMNNNNITNKLIQLN
jgi:hypothetical protein